MNIELVIIGVLVLVTIIIIVWQWQGKKDQPFAGLFSPFPYKGKGTLKIDTNFRKGKLIITKTGLVYSVEGLQDIYSGDPSQDYCLSQHNNIEFKVPHKHFLTTKNQMLHYYNKEPYVWDPKEKYIIQYKVDIKNQLPPKLVTHNFQSFVQIENKMVQTNIHYDLLPVVIVQVKGTQKVVIWNPKEKDKLEFNHPISHPLYRQSQLNSTQQPKTKYKTYYLAKGDYIYIPPDHPRSFYTTSESISVRCRYYS